MINDSEKAKDIMIAMTQFLEGMDQKFVLDKDNRGMRNSINYIQAFEININNWEGKFKLSQDKCEQDQKRAKIQLIKTSQNNIEDFLNEIFSLPLVRMFQFQLINLLTSSKSSPP